MNTAKKATKRTAAKAQTYEGFTEDERGAMKERARELKTASRRDANDEGALLAKIAEIGRAHV